MYGYIYKITNKINGKIYIGQHSKSDGSLEEMDESYWGSGIKIINAIKKYGKEAFTREILYWCDSLEELNNKEKYYITTLNCLDDNLGYNIAEGGSAGNLISRYSKEEKEAHYNKISKGNKKVWENIEIRNKYLKSFCNRRQSWKNNISKSLIGHKGHPMSKENKEKLKQRSLGNKYGLGNKSRTGQKFSEETKNKLSLANKKVPHTEEWNKKVSNSLKGIPKSEEHKQALRKPKPKYYWKLSDGTIKIMDSSNGSKHKDWIKLNLVTENN